MLKTLTQNRYTLSPFQKEYQRILVAVDYLEPTPEIFKKALEMAKKEGSHLIIFHCLQGEIPAAPEYPFYVNLYAGVHSLEMLELEEKLIREATEQFQEWLDVFVQQANVEGVEAEVSYCSGDAGKQICKTAKEWGADLIIVGRSGKTGLSEFILGSVSNYVVHHAPCSVLVIQH